MAHDTETDKLTIIEHAILAKLRALPPDKQQEVLAFVESLQQSNCQPPEPNPQPRRSIVGLWDHLGVDITEEDIDEARREMWGNFPRDDI